MHGLVLALELRAAVVPVAVVVAAVAVAAAVVVAAPVAQGAGTTAADPLLRLCDEGLRSSDALVPAVRGGSSQNWPCALTSPRIQKQEAELPRLTARNTVA